MDRTELQDIKKRYNIVGNSDQLNHVLDVALQVAPTDLSVLIVGESGVGKEVIPRIIHDCSQRRREKYFAINCGAIPEGTIDSELFGHVKGAFTGAVGEHPGYFGVVNKGTLFLDEVGELPMSTQARLLRVLETGEYIPVGGTEVRKTDVRVVAATNVNVRRAISEGRFREDLYYRLSSIPIKMPPLRERGEDILLLFRLFVMQMVEKYKMDRIELTDGAKQMMLKYKWPGNVRQLKNITEQLAVLSHERTINEEMLGQFIPNDRESTMLATVGGNTGGSHSFETEREVIYKVMMDMRSNMETMRQEIDGLKKQLADVKQGSRNDNTPVIDTTQTVTALPQSAAQIQQPIYFDSAHTPAVVDAVAEEYVEPAERETMNLDKMERQMTEMALEKHKGKRKQAAQELGISERTLYRRIHQYGLDDKY
ncbi:MAG: sigma 54-interacting transcriptional regulator [Prevotella sp.]|nr:sigma 54-interacting transcriptional regulator [Prevotella sp.]